MSTAEKDDVEHIVNVPDRIHLQGTRDHATTQQPKALAKAKAKAAAAPKAQPAPPPAPVAAEDALPLRPVGRPPATSVEVLTTVAWMDRLLADVATAGEVLVASYTYDHPGLTASLVRRLILSVLFTYFYLHLNALS